MHLRDVRPHARRLLMPKRIAQLAGVESATSTRPSELALPPGALQSTSVRRRSDRGLSPVGGHEILALAHIRYC
jgi:hypothetical protein